MPDRPWPAGVEPRRRRPTDTNLFPALLGAVLGGLITGGVGAVVGGGAGLAASPTEKRSLEQAIRAECARRGVEVFAFERPAQGHIDVTVRVQGSFWTLRSSCPYVDVLTQEDIDDWLFGDTIDVALAQLLGNAE